MRAFFCVLVLLAAATASASSVHLSGDSKGLYRQLYKLSSKSIKGLDRTNEILEIAGTSEKGLRVDKNFWNQLQETQNQLNFGTISIIDLTEYTSSRCSVVVSNMIISLNEKLMKTLVLRDKPFFDTAEEKLVFNGPQSLEIVCNCQYFYLKKKIVLGDSVETLTVNFGAKSDFAHFFDKYKNLNTYRLEGSLEAKRVERSQQIIVDDFSRQPMSNGDWDTMRTNYRTLQFTVKAAACSIQDESKRGVPNDESHRSSGRKADALNTRPVTSSKQAPSTPSETGPGRGRSGSSNGTQEPRAMWSTPSGTGPGRDRSVSSILLLKGGNGTQEPRATVSSPPSGSGPGLDGSKSPNSTATSGSGTQEPASAAFFNDSGASTLEPDQGSEASASGRREGTESDAVDTAPPPFQWLKDEPVLHADPVVDLILRLFILIGGCFLLPIIVALLMHRSAVASYRAALVRSSSFRRRIKCIGGV